MTVTADKKSIKEQINDFYNGKLYPIFIALLVVFGATTGTEAVTMLIHAVVLYGIFLYSDSIKPLLISLFTFVYQISVEHAPQYPTESDYLVTSWRIWFLVTAGVLIVAGIVIFFVRNKIFTVKSLKETPLLIPTLILSLGFLANGLFSGEWIINNLIISVAHVAIYLGVYLLIYNGFSKKETAGELASYFSYLAMLCALIISAELIHLMITNPDVFADGSIVKTEMALGWGIWNLIGVSLAILIPLLFYGVYENKYPWLYFSVATLAYVMSVLTMSRNALVFSSLTYGACMIISCFVGRHKKQFRIITACGIALLAVLAIVLFDKIYVVLADYFERGLDDNGRFDLWRGSFKSFLDAPIFGSGFYGLDINHSQFGFLPKMAHQTLFELLGAMGIFGTLCYAYYRYKTVLPVLKKPNLMKTMLGISILTLLMESMLDNFIFNFYPVFYYVAALAIINKAYSEQKTL